MIDQLHGLRCTLGDVLMDARAAKPQGMLVADVEPQVLPAPRPLRGLVLNPVEIMRVLLEIEKWVGQQTGYWLRELKSGLGGLWATSHAVLATTIVCPYCPSSP